VRTSEVASTVPPLHIEATLAMYVVLYVTLITSYIAVLRHMAGKPAREGPVTPQIGKPIAGTVQVISGSFNNRGFMR
jgi:hypothetical protein